MFLKILPSALYTRISPLSPGFVKQIMLIFLMLQQQFSHLNSRKLDHRQVQASYIFYVWLHLVLYCKHAHSHDF
jgi:hypothetical protein